MAENWHADRSDKLLSTCISLWRHPMRHFVKRHLISRFCSNLEMTKVQRSTLNSWPGKTIRDKDLKFDTRVEHLIIYLLCSVNEGSKTLSLWCNLWSKKTLHFQYLSFSWKRTYNPHIYITIIRFGLTFNFVSPISQEKNPCRWLKIGMLIAVGPI